MYKHIIQLTLFLTWFNYFRYQKAYYISIAFQDSKTFVKVSGRSEIAEFRIPDISFASDAICPYVGFE
jgi:hypothetical protein